MKVSLIWRFAPLILLAGQFLVLGKSFVRGDWLLDAQGHPVFADFASFWTTGLQIREEPAVEAYDWERHKIWEERWFASEDQFLGWHYAPTFFFVAWALGGLPYLPAFLAWVGSTLALYAAAISSILNFRFATLLACAFPAVAWTAVTGQTALLAAALIAASLRWTEHRPYLAGIALGCLSFKPQFGILFPLALAAAGYWRTIASAAITTTALAALSSLCFGVDTWPAFFENIPRLGKLSLQAHIGQLQSAVGLARLFGAASNVAFMVQGVVAATATTAVFLIWRGHLPFDLKAASLAAATLLVSPYLFTYDFPILAVALAFLIRHGLTMGTLRPDLPVTPASLLIRPDLPIILLASLMIFMTPALSVPIGFFATLLVFGLIGYRCYTR